MTVRIKFMKIVTQKGRKKWDWAKLDRDANRGAFQREIEEKLKGKMGSIVNVEDRWQVLNDVVIASAEKKVG